MIFQILRSSFGIFGFFGLDQNRLKLISSCAIGFPSPCSSTHFVHHILLIPFVVTLVVIFTTNRETKHSTVQPTNKTKKIQPHKNNPVTDQDTSILVTHYFQQQGISFSSLLFSCLCDCSRSSCVGWCLPVVGLYC